MNKQKKEQFPYIPDCAYKIDDVIGPFVRAGYNEALLTLGNWITDQKEDCIPVGVITKFIIKEISTKKEIKTDKLIKEIAKKNNENQD